MLGPLPSPHAPPTPALLSFFIIFPYEHFQPIGAHRGANSAIVPAVVLKVMFFLPLITGPHIHDGLPGQPWTPDAAGQGPRRTGLDAPGAPAAKAPLFGRLTGQFHIGKHGSQTDPRAELAGDKLAVAADPAQPGPGGRGFMGEIPFYVNRI